MKINFDEGYAFGLGLFETIHLYKNKALFLDEHLKRLNNSIETLGLNFSEITKREILSYLEKNRDLEENEVLKIILSEKNKIFLKREYKYRKENYNDGFRLNLASIRRNESSIFTYHKTLNYAENIYEKKKSIKFGYDEALFLNTKGLVTEGATSNIFFVENDKLITPKLKNGLLGGIIRKWLIERYEVKEIEIPYDDIKYFDEGFLTNSLFGIMPIKSIENLTFRSRKKSDELFKEYRENIED